jgi:hypothetical protein
MLVEAGYLALRCNQSVRASVFSSRVSGFLVLALALGLASAGITDTGSSSSAAANPAADCPTFGDVAFTMQTVTFLGQTKVMCATTISDTAGVEFDLPGALLFGVQIAGGAGGRGGSDNYYNDDLYPGQVGGRGAILSGNIELSGRVGLYPGGKGGDGKRMGAVGPAGFSALNFSGGEGGTDGTANFSGGGGGGGAGSALTISGTVAIIAGGGGGSGGVGYCASPPWPAGHPGTSLATPATHVARSTGESQGETPGTKAVDGGGGGGGGGGLVGGKGGEVQTYQCGESGGAPGSGGHLGSSKTSHGDAVFTSAAYNQSNTGAGYIRLFLAPPGKPDLKSEFDLGSSSTDDVTSVAEPTLNLTGLVGGEEASISFTKGAELLSYQFTPDSSSFDFTVPEALSDGQWSVVTTTSIGASEPLILTIDTVEPTANSISIVPDLIHPKRVRITITFSEPLSSVDASKISVGSDAAPWVISGATTSGSTYAFDVTYDELIEDDITVAVAEGAVTDTAGNLLATAREFFQAVDLASLTATFQPDPVRISTTPTTRSINVSFNRNVWGLASNDFSLVGTNGANCTIGTVSPSVGPARDYTLAVTCSATGANQVSTLRLAANAVKDFAAITGPAVALDLTVIRDTVVPTVSVVTKTVSERTASYEISFSEPVQGLTAERFVPTLTPGTNAGWVVSNLVEISSSRYSFDFTNPETQNGQLTFTLSPGVTDLAGNALNAAGLTTAATAVQILNPPTFDPGPSSFLGPIGSKIAEAFELDSLGSSIWGIKIEIVDAAAGDSLNFTNQTHITRVTTGATASTATTLYLQATTARSDAEWEAAIRSVTFSTTATGPSTREFEYHVKPLPGYDYESGSLFRFVPGVAITYANARTGAEGLSLFGLQGYLATPTSPQQHEALLLAGPQQQSWLGIGAVGGFNDRVKILEGPGKDTIVMFAPCGNWNQVNHSPANGVAHISTMNGGCWNDLGTSDNGAIKGYMVEFGGSAGDPALQLTQLQTHSLDLSAPSVVSVSSLVADGTYIAGDIIRIEVEFDEATIVAGTPRIKLNTAPTRYATYVSGSGTDRLIFEYTVAPGDLAADLNYLDTESLELNSGSLTDLAGNPAIRTLPTPADPESLGSAAALVIDADLFIPPSFTLGTMPSIGLNVVQVAPQFDLTVRGLHTPFGIRITNKSFDPLASTPDNFILSPLPAGVQLVKNADGVIELYSETLNEAQWEAAIREIRFDAGSSGAAPEFEFHLRPLKAYDYETGHAYRFFNAGPQTFAQHQALAEASSLAGFSGYLANITSAAESALIVSHAGVSTWAIIGLQKQQLGAGASTPVKIVSPENQAGDIDYRNWSGGEPNISGDMCLMVYPNGLWNDVGCNDGYAGYLVEYGGTTPGSNFLASMVATHTYEFDLTAPTVTLVTALTPAGTYVAGDRLNIRVRFSEPISVTGSPRLNLDMGLNIRSATCVAAAIDTDLVCSYEVQQGDVTSDLGYVSQASLVLNGGTITDSAANPAVLTLPAVGSPQSLSGSSALVIDGNRIDLVLTADSPTSTVRALTFTLTSTLPIDCSSLSAVDGVDFVFESISSIDRITASVDNKTCTIEATSAVLPGQYGISSLQAAPTFSIDDRQNPPTQTSQVLIRNSAVDVEIAAQAGHGLVVVNPVAGQRRTVFENQLPEFVASAEMAAGRAALERNNILAAPEDNPGALVEGDFSQASGRIDAKAREQIFAGDKVNVALIVDPALVATHEVIVYFRSTLDPEELGWAYLGKRDFDTDGLAVSEPMVFTKRGTYYLKLIVIEKGTDFRTSFASPATFTTLGSSVAVFNIGLRSQSSFYVANQTPILDSDLPIGVQILEVAVEVIGTEPTISLPPGTNNGPAAPSTPANPSTPSAPSPAFPTAPTPELDAETTPDAQPAPGPSLPDPAPGASTAEPVAPPAAEPATPPAGSATADAAAGGATAGESGDGAAGTTPAEPDAEATAAPAETPDASEPTVTQAAALEPYDPFGSPEATRQTAGLLAALGALGAVAAAAAAAGAASAGSAAGSSGGMGAAEMNEDSLDALAGAEFELDVFRDEKDRWGDKLAIWAIPLLSFLDRPTHRFTRSSARFSPLVSKLLNDGAYLRAMLGSVSILPTLAAIGLAIWALQLNDEILLHPPIALFVAIMVIGLFDSFAGALGVLVFVLGSLPLLNPAEVTDWRMLAGIVVAGFGPVVLARSIRNFRRKAPRDNQAWLDRVGDIAFASLLGGWVAGLVLRALPALTGLAVPAAEYVFEVQIIATIAIALRIVLEDLAARFYPARMDHLTPDTLPEPFRGQRTLVTVLRYFFYVFIASAFMGFGFVVWVAAALFMVPTLLGLFIDKLPRVKFLANWLPTGLPGLAMILGLEILLENSLAEALGDHPDFATIFVFSLLALIVVVSTLGMLARPEPGEQHWLSQPGRQTLYRVGGFVTFLLILQFTSML